MENERRNEGKMKERRKKERNGESWRKRKIEMSVLITLGNNFLHFECCLDFYDWFRVFVHYWMRKWHPFLSIRSGFVPRWFEKNQILWQNRLHFCGIISWFFQHPKYVFKRKNVLQTTYTDYLIETSITVNWMAGIDKGKYT